MTTINGVSGAGGVGNLQSMDLETAMMAVQSQRSQLLEDQLKGQIAAVQSKNEQIAAMNDTINVRRDELAQIDAAIPANEAEIERLTTMRDNLAQVKGRDPNGWTGLSWGWAGDDKAASQDMLKQVQAEGLTNAGPAPRDVDGNGTMDAHGTTVSGWIDQLNSKIDALAAKNEAMKADQVAFKTEIDTLKTNIDSLSNSQQMDMLRLQSLSNKRNEAFDLMTNFIKKMADSRSSIMSNMR